MSSKIEKSRWAVYGVELSFVAMGLVFLILSLCGKGMSIVPPGSQISSAGCAILFGVALIALEQIFRYRLPIMLHIIYIIYVFASNIIGSNIGVFRLAVEPFEWMGVMISNFYWYDKVMHAILGYVLCIVAVYIGLHSKLWDRGFWSNILVVLAISMAFASIWEIFEFTMDSIIPGQDMQRGPLLLDTMCDMIAHFLTTVIFLVQYAISHYTKCGLGMHFIVANLRTGGSVRQKKQQFIDNASVANEQLADNATEHEDIEE